MYIVTINNLIAIFHCLSMISMHKSSMLIAFGGKFIIIIRN